ncbi:Citrate lyase subunit beta-like protein [Corynebacterium faecale]|uniref:HpcH/HpaI aldolase/citrate lyase family protein n=1 Tax=Corynebacterium faecale TaxID=1758466 RepID=UPI0025B5C056|nr:CoA ester lyase [Corynebacterium faecale]WJY91672.1 Citrate lyase subunit beta-like protein [Corynebacterium faecale]
MNYFTTGTTALFSPADRPDRALKALASPSDLVILDLEDAVALDQESKHMARTGLHPLLQQVPERTGVVIRINSPETIEGKKDLREIAHLSGMSGLPNFAIMVPKLTLSTPLNEIPQNHPIIGLIETADAVRDLFAIAAHPRVDRLALGAVDLSTELNCDSTSATIDHVRAQLVIASVAAGVAAPLESPCVHFQDTGIVKDAARRARRDGFGGMLCIHPRQLEGVSEAFRPDEKDIIWAQKVLNTGGAAASVDGEMVDRPVLMRAQKILAAAE